MKVLIYRVLLLLLITTIVITTACGGGSEKTSTTYTIQTPITTSISTTIDPTAGAPSIEELKEQGFVKPELPRIKAEVLKQLMDIKENYILVDVRGHQIYEFYHLPKAINLPSNTEDEQIAGFSKLPKDKLIIIYWGWPDDAESAISVDRLIELDAGFDLSNVLILWKGYKEWQALGYPLEN